jgi:hypothetical protein
LPAAPAKLQLPQVIFLLGDRNPNAGHIFGRKLLDVLCVQKDDVVRM